MLELVFYSLVPELVYCLERSDEVLELVFAIAIVILVEILSIFQDYFFHYYII